MLAVERGLGMETFAWTGSYTVDPSGRGVMNLTDLATGGQKTIVFWAVSPTKVFAILGTSADDTDPVLIQMQR